MFKRLKPTRRVAIFGGSFNPPHIGHGQIVAWILDRGFVDEVWIVPCFQHPFGKKFAAFEHRFAMCRLAFGRFGKGVRVLDIEKKLGGVSFTLRTVEHFKKSNPNMRFWLVTGEDVDQEISLWHESQKMRGLVDFIKIPRGPHSRIVDISSTDVRDKIASSGAFDKLVEKEVAVYIVTKGIYRE